MFTKFKLIKFYNLNCNYYFCNKNLNYGNRYKERY